MNVGDFLYNNMGHLKLINIQFVPKGKLVNYRYPNI